jgi:hypothetical protein
VENNVQPVENLRSTCGKPVETLWNLWGKFWTKIRIAKNWHIDSRQAIISGLVIAACSNF